MSRTERNQVLLAAEDRFLIVSIRNALALCPSASDAETLGEAIELAKPLLGDLIPLFDLRGLPKIYNDVDLFLEAAGGLGAHILVNPETSAQIDIEYYSRTRGMKVLSVKGYSYRAKPFDLSNLRIDGELYGDPFFHFASSMVDQLVYDDVTDLPSLEDDCIWHSISAIESPGNVFTPSRLEELVTESGFSFADAGEASEFASSVRLFFPKIQEFLAGVDLKKPVAEVKADLHLETEFCVRSALLHAFLRQIHQNSLLVEFVMTANNNSITFTPYHGSAIHEIQQPRRSDVLIGRPAVVARKTGAIFSPEIEQFQHLLNDPNTRERHLQGFLEQHPNFLTGLSYKNVYPQLVLERTDGTRLQPDFLMEPFDGEFCDILDIKLPRQSIIVGRRDRATLAAGIHEVAAQLREYSAYFDEDRHRTYVNEKYGLKVYKPRLIAIVGRDMRQMSEPQIRRAMTQYTDMKMMTFDDLVEHAKTRLLL